MLTKDYIPLFKANKTNALLLIPISTIVLPMTIRYPTIISKTLIIPYLITLAILILSFARAFSSLRP